MPAVAEFRAWGVNEKGWAPKTALGYSTWIVAGSRFLQEERGVDLAAATTEDLKAYLFSQGPANTRNNVRCAFIGFFEHLCSLGLREDNPGLGRVEHYERRGGRRLHLGSRSSNRAPASRTRKRSHEHDRYRSVVRPSDVDWAADRSGL